MRSVACLLGLPSVCRAADVATRNWEDSAVRGQTSLPNEHAQVVMPGGGTSQPPVAAMCRRTVGPGASLEEFSLQLFLFFTYS